jgi:site-specific recombinase XerD
MAAALQLVERASLSTDLVDLAALAAEYAEARRSPRTWAAYRSDWRQFAPWCEARGLDALPASPSTVAAYLADRAGTLKVATLQRHLSAIAVAHREAGYPVPQSEQLRMVWAGIRRTHGTAQDGKAPLLAADVRAMVGALGDRPIDARDRLVILTGFGAALRRSELVALNVGDITITVDGLVVAVRRSKRIRKA